MNSIGQITFNFLAASENIVFRAIDALAHEVGRTEPDFLEVRLEKHIPH